MFHEASLVMPPPVSTMQAVESTIVCIHGDKGCKGTRMYLLALVLVSRALET